MLADRVSQLKPSPTLALATKAKEMKAQGLDVISLSVGEPDWDTFDVVKAAAKKAIDDGHTKYTPANGVPELREAIAKQVSADTGVEYSPKQVTVSSGGKFILFSAIHSLVNPNDEVIIPIPYWVSYPAMVSLAEGKSIFVECNEKEDFKLTPELLQGAITDKTKMVMLNTPSNPTGKAYSKDELKALAEVLKKHPNVVVLTDDIYNRLMLSSDGVAAHILNVAPELADRTVSINGISKTYSMTGWRIGWATGPEKLIAAMSNYQSQSVSCSSAVSQQAALSAIRDTESDVKKALVSLKERCQFVCEQIVTIEGFELSPPDGAFYVFPKVSAHFGKSWKGQKIEDSRAFAAALLESQKVVLVPGAEFGLDGFVRISFAISRERMTEAIQRIKAFIAELN